jgi:hypothetical protein
VGHDRLTSPRRCCRQSERGERWRRGTLQAGA